MDIRQYLALLRRQRWLVLATVLLVTLSTVAFYEARPAQYRATASVIFRTEDPNERFFAPAGQPPSAGPNVDSEAAFVKSLAVAEAAARGLPGSSPSQLLDQVSATPFHETGIVEIHATDQDPARARDIATAFAQAFAENRRQAAADRRKRVAEQAGARLTELQERIAQIDAELGGPPPAPAAGAPALAAGPPGSLQAQRHAAALLYQQIFERQQLLLVEQSLNQGGAEFAAEAPLPREPVGPGLVQALIVAAFVGLLLGVCLAVLREYLIGRVRSRDDVEEEAGLTVLAEIPNDRSFRRGLGKVAVAEQPLGPTAEAARTLRTKLLGLRPESPLRSIVVTSPNARDGKSFVAANLAAVYAQVGYRTVLVSSDLRRPSLDALLGAGTKGGGLTGLLRAPELRPPASGPVPGHPFMVSSPHRTLVEEALVATEVPNLSFLPAGSLPKNPADLLSSAAMGDTLEALQDLADIVVLDTPPLLAVADAAALAAKVDGVLMVTALGHTPRGAVKKAMELLDAPDVRVLGTVLNKISQSRSQRSAYYHYVGSLVDEESRPAPTDEPSNGNKAQPRETSFRV